ncbi:MAG TPA: MFS transporter [Candidatus Eisenbacteria bacterium]|nr:MFS transporter [Candidatus Eisenbacteria bacterium]
MPSSPSKSRQPLPPRLLLVVALLAISLFINYIDRGNLSIAAPMLKDELHISATQLGFLLSAFFWTYACLNLFYGWLVDRVNVNWLFAGAFFLWSAATAATGLVHTFAVLFALRLLLGFGEAAAFPSYNKILALNFTEEHRGLANSVLAMGLLVGPGIGLLSGGFLMGRYGWRPFFTVLGLASLLWIVPWLIWMPRKRYAAAPESVGRANLLDFILMRSAWGTCLGLFFANYVNYFLITWFPYYLVRVRHFSMEELAKIGGAAYLLGGLASPVCGWLADRWIAAGASPTLARKTFVAGGIASCGICLGLAGVAGPRFSVAAVVLCVVSFGVMSSNHWAISQTLAGPSAAGRWVGFQNFFGNLSGIIAPAVTGYVVDRTGHFFWAFAIAATVGLASAACWIFVVGPLEPVIWNHELRAAARASRSDPARPAAL